MKTMGISTPIDESKPIVTPQDLAGQDLGAVQVKLLQKILETLKKIEAKA